MAYKIIYQKRFIIRSSEVADWIEKKWSKKSANKFTDTLYEKVESLRVTPFAGSLCPSKAHYRKLVITKHNKIYYRVKGKTIYIVDLVDSRQDPGKNKYE